MSKRTLPAMMLLATMSVAAQAAEMILYENPGFNGRQLAVSGYLPDIKAAGFDDHNASILIRSGTWEVCADANFRGFCATLQPNEYGSLDTRFNGRIASARVVGAPVADAGPARRERTGSIAIYSRAGYRGRGITLERNTPDFEGVRFNDRASSLVVRKGTWELCSDDGYRGTCQVFAPGRYADLGSLTNEVSSARMLRSRNER